ncbi:MAG: hypothetical protein MUF51_07065 [Vicinamibacteria bacterium]|jgi:hypothetical protein|nr:hypothetical protein [Vicinamibacteria bacterium]
MVMAVVVGCGVCAAWPLRAAKQEPPEVMLEVTATRHPEEVPQGAAPRFILLADGRVFVGGSSRVGEGQLQGEELVSLKRELERVRKMKDLPTSVAWGSSADEYRLVFRKGPVIVATGDPAQAPFAQRVLAALFERLANFSHPSLKPYQPESYRLTVRAGQIMGGCRPWLFPFPLADALKTPKTVPASAVSGWPTGSMPASVCADERRYIVTLRPILPVEGAQPELGR